MGKIYFVRHGQSEWNIANKICGATDVPLTELGHEQAIITGMKILEQGIQCRCILSSPLMRAYDTAVHIGEITGFDVKKEMRLIEQNFGRFEGTPRNGAEFAVAKRSFCTRYDGGESMLMVAARIYDLLDELKQDGGDYILVAHNGISRVVKSYFCEMSNEEYAEFRVLNCSITEFEF